MKIIPASGELKVLAAVGVNMDKSDSLLSF